jgi:uncharacterized tellurite resistance protein B-like protein
MIAAIRSFFDEHLRSPSEESDSKKEQEIALATAALFYEVVGADQSATQDEKNRVLDLLGQTFEFDPEELQQLAALAEEEVQDSHDLFQFTRLINENFDEEQRMAVIANMWRVAWADGEIHHFEEHLIRKVADLLHLHHSHFIQAKLMARDEHVEGA